MREWLRARAARDALVVLGAQGTSALIALGVDAYLFRTLPKAEQGALTAGMSISSMLLQASDLGLALTTIRLGAKHIAEGRADLAAQVFRKTLLARTLCSILLIAFAVIFSGAIARGYSFDTPQSRWLVAAASCGIFGNALAWWGVDVSQARRAFGAYAAQQLAGAALRAAGVAAAFLILAYSPNGGDAMGTAITILGAIAATNLIAGFFSLGVERRAATVPGILGDAEEPRLFEFGMFACAISVLTALASNADVFLTQHYLGEEETAVFACARRLAMALNLLAVACITVLLPRAAALKTRAECAVYLRKAVKVGVVLAIVTAGGLAFAAEILVPIFGGAKYQASVPILRWLCLAHGIQIAITPILLVFYPLRLERALVSVYLLGLAVLAAAGTRWTPVYQLEGTAWAVVVSKLALLVAGSLVLWRVFRAECPDERDIAVDSSTRGG